MPLPPSCPYPPLEPARISTVAELPAGARALLGDMADPGRPFQASDALPAGAHPPFKRLVSAEGLGCSLTVAYEQGGIAHQWRTARMVFDGGAWKLPGR